MAVDRGAVAILDRYKRAGACEIGTHLHPWNTPPCTEERNERNSFTSNLPSNLQYEKIKSLHEAIAQNFGTPPTTYRSGRWGFNEDVAKNLIRLGYRIDTSIYPMWDWSSAGGPDYRRCSYQPFVYRTEAGAHGAAGSLLEVPATVDFLQRRRSAAASAFWTIKRWMPAPDKVLAVLGKLGVTNLVCLSPELSRASDMIRLATSLLARGAGVVNLFFHSPSLLPGCSPFVRTEGDADAFLARIDEFLRFAQAAGLTTATMAELTAEKVGASATRTLSTV